MATVALLGTLDTKGREYAFLRDRVREHGVDVLLLDAGILGEPLTQPDIGRDEIAEAAGVKVAALVSADDRGAAIEFKDGGPPDAHPALEDRRLAPRREGAPQDAASHAGRDRPRPQPFPAALPGPRQSLVHLGR